MKVILNHTLKVLLSVALVFSVVNTSTAVTAQTECNSVCLNGFMDKFLNALVTHKPANLPLSADVKYTENTIRINLGEELWNTVTEITPFKVYVPDSYSNQIAFFGIIIEDGSPKLLSVRLKIKNELISEIEAVVTRKGFGGSFPENMADRKVLPIWNEKLKPAEQVSRLAMIKAVDLYFEGIEQKTAAIVPFDESCNRIENGMQTTNNTEIKSPDGKPHFLSLGCIEQFNTRPESIQYTIPERRYWLVDEARGIVAGMFIFAVKGAHNAVPIAEFFKIKNGRIYEVEAIGVSDPLPYGAKSGW